MFLFLPVICHNHTNLLHGLTLFWRVISENSWEKDESAFQLTKRHLSEIMCRSAAASTQLSGHFPSSYTKDLCHLHTVFHSQSPWKNQPGDRRICCYQPQIFQKACPTLRESTYSPVLREPTWGWRLVQDATSFQKLLSGCRKSQENEDCITYWQEIFTFGEVVWDIKADGFIHFRGEQII